jgi:hypothetical protein
MKEIVYIETTIVSYLVAQPCRDLVLAAHQQVTRDWWREDRTKFVCITSDEVLREASLGEPAMSALRMEALRELPVIQTGPEMRELAQGILDAGILPESALSDMLHVVAAAVSGAAVLLTWNCRHLANPHLAPRLRKYLEGKGLAVPEICTPIELAGE